MSEYEEMREEIRQSFCRVLSLSLQFSLIRDTAEELLSELFTAQTKTLRIAVVKKEGEFPQSYISEKAVGENYGSWKSQIGYNNAIKAMLKAGFVQEVREEKEVEG